MPLASSISLNPSTSFIDSFMILPGLRVLAIKGWSENVSSLGFRDNVLAASNSASNVVFSG
ncbi:MAG: hypothetical protein BWY72_01802 [Bacteroidetes bacterium ADurb.Bin416]|nr:MAG: hypothetical protein BWY72_01802 [Bacteroidetes bacterium ADurb.Bin416]